MPTEALYPIVWTATNCDNSQLPLVKFAECAELVQQDESQVHGILLCDIDPNDPEAPATAAPATLSDLAGWELVIGDTAALWKHLIVIGDLAEAEQEERIISKGRIVKGKKNFTLNADVDDTTDENYAFMIELERSPEKFMFFYDRQHIWGPIKCQVTKANVIKARGEGSYDIFSYVIRWEHPHSPPRTTNPFTI